MAQLLVMIMSQSMIAYKLLIPKLFNVMIRFQLHQIALVADIESAFLMVGVSQEDRDMFRFLWLKEPDSEIVL